MGSAALKYEGCFACHHLEWWQQQEYSSITGSVFINYAPLPSYSPYRGHTTGLLEENEAQLTS